MHKKALGLAVAVMVGAVLVSASGAATTQTQKVTKINVSTRAAVVHYLRSIHVNPKHAVIQRGLRNYAGAHCPGARWACASTKHTVVQIAKQGGQNRFLCKSSKCVVVQISGASHGLYTAGRIATASPNKSGGNSGYCVKTGSGATTGGGQTCSIIQLGSPGANTAGIYENSNKVTGLSQTLQFTATIQQSSSGTGSAGNNTACVTQNIIQDGSASNTNTKGVTVNLQAIQSITITQNTLTGDNAAVSGADSTTGHCTSQSLTQSQTQSSTVSTNGNITQSMNPSVSGLTGGNVSLDIEQNQAPRGVGTGKNSAVFSQTTNQTAIANAKTGKTVTQQQNATDGDGITTPFSGIVGTINQDSTHQSTADVTQNEIQCEDAANTSNSAALTGCATTTDAAAPSGITLTQTQNGPVGLFTPRAKNAGRVPYYHKGTGTSEQTGAGTGVFDSFKLTQTSSQYADPSNPPNVTVNQSNVMQGDCKSSGDSSLTGGSCQASQKATLNGGTTAGDTQDGYTAGSITKLLIKCEDGHGSCTATPPPTPVLTVTPDNPSEDTSPTFEWTEGGSAATVGVSFTCTLDGVPASCVSGDAFPVGLGPHTFEVTASDNFGHTSDPTASFGWTVVPYLTFEQFGTGSSAGWTDNAPGSSITLVVGTDPPTESYGQFTLHNFEGITINALPAEPTFTTDVYNGSPRYEIDLDNGHYLFGYPPEAGFGSGSWDVNCGDDLGCTPLSFVSWDDVKAAEGSATVTDVLIEADSNAGDMYKISDFKFDGYVLIDFTSHFH